jgi:hypothetical protein
MEHQPFSNLEESTSHPTFSYGFFINEYDAYYKEHLRSAKGIKMSSADIGVRELLNKLKPVFYFYNKETYFSSSVPHYMEHCELRHATDTDKILKSPPLKNSTLNTRYNISNKNMHPYTDGRFFMTPPVSQKAKVWHLNSPKTYPMAHAYGRITETETHYRVLYTFYCPYNEGYTLPILQKKDNLDIASQELSIPILNKTHEWKQTGYHEADWEHVIYLYDKETLKLTRARYSAHADIEGQWLSPEDLEYENGHPVVYISHRAHACYPQEKNWLRVYGFANDKCNKGYKWEPYILDMPENEREAKREEEINVIVMKRMNMKYRVKMGAEVVSNLNHEWGWLFFRGGFGDDGIGSPYYRDWWSRDVGEDVQSSFAVRFFRKVELKDKMNKLKTRILDWIKSRELEIDVLEKIKEDNMSSLLKNKTETQPVLENSMEGAKENTSSLLKNKTETQSVLENSMEGEKENTSSLLENKTETQPVLENSMEGEKENTSSLSEQMKPISTPEHNEPTYIFEETNVQQSKDNNSLNVFMIIKERIQNDNDYVSQLMNDEPVFPISDIKDEDDEETHIPYIPSNDLMEIKKSIEHQKEEQVNEIIQTLDNKEVNDFNQSEPISEPVPEPVKQPNPAPEPISEPVKQPTPIPEPIPEPVKQPNPAPEPVKQEKTIYCCGNKPQHPAITKTIQPIQSEISSIQHTTAEIYKSTSPRPNVRNNKRPFNYFRPSTQKQPNQFAVFAPLSSILQR